MFVYIGVEKRGIKSVRQKYEPETNKIRAVMDKIGKILTLTSIHYSLTSKMWELPRFVKLKRLIP